MATKRPKKPRIPKVVKSHSLTRKAKSAQTRKHNLMTGKTKPRKKH